MNKQLSLNLGAIICVIVSSYCIYYLLLLDDFLPFSIDSATCTISHFSHHTHIIVFGLLPVYLGLMVFGTAMLGVYFGSAIQRWISYLFSHN